MTRRDHGSGSIYQRASDGMWVGTIEAGYYPNGGRRRITVSSKERRAVVKKLRDKRLQLGSEGAPDVSARTTVKAWSEEWLGMIVHTARPKHYSNQASQVRKWIVPTIGHRRLEQLAPADVRAVHTAIRDAGNTSTTALGAHRCLMSMLKAAQQEGHRVAARVLAVTPPAPAVNDRAAVAALDALAILKAASERPDGVTWLLALAFGQRQAERLGLTVDAIDFERGRIINEWQLQSLPYLDRKDKGKGFRVPDGFEARHLIHAFHLTRPKTKKGYRAFPMPDPIAEALKSWLEVAPANPWGLLFTTTDPRAGHDGPRPINDKKDREAWHDLQAAAGVAHPSGRPYHLHEARHGLATALKEEEVDDHTITALLGHASILTSHGYMHVSDAAARKAMEKIAARLELG